MEGYLNTKKFACKLNKLADHLLNPALKEKYSITLDFCMIGNSSLVLVDRILQLEGNQEESGKK
jgi:hypothetical protein